MKKLLFFFTALAYNAVCTAQSGLLFGLGYNGVNADLAGLNRVIDRYNDSRSNLTKKMPYITGGHGGTVTAKLIMGPVMVELGYSGFHQTVSASGPDATKQMANRDFKYRQRLASLGGGAFIPVKKNIAAIGLGATVDFGSYHYFTRRYYEGETKPDLVEIRNIVDVVLGVTMFPELYLFRGKVLAINIRPYYQVQLFEQHFDSADEILNPNSYNSFDEDEINRQMNKPRNKGIMVTLCIGGFSWK